jgi:WD40 repeat protein
VVPAAFGETRTATFSPDSRHFAIAGDDRMLRVFSTDTLTMRVLRGHGAPISALAFSPDSASLASASLDKTVRLWSVTAGGLREIAVPEGGSWGFKLSEGDREVALPRTIHGRPALYIADVKTGLTRELLSPTATRAVSLQSSSGQPLSDSDVGLRRYLLDGGACEHGTPSTDLLACAYSRDGNLLASGGLDTIVRVYDQTANATRVLGQHEGSVVRIAFSADEHFLASGSSDKTVRVWDLSNGASRVLRGHEGDVEDVAFTSDGSRLGSVSMDGTLRVWDLRTEEARVFGGDQLAARALAFTHDDRFALTGDRSGSVRLWDLATGEARVVRRHAAFVRALAVTKDDRTVLSIGGDGAVWLWDLDTRRPFSRDPNELRAWMGELSAAE